MRHERRLLLAAAAASLLGALLIGWFYVRRHLVARLRVLTEAATSIASGQSSALLPKAGNDELGDLTRALAVFRQTRDDLIQAAKLAALGQMAAGLSHELNQPLAAIRSHAHNGALLLERGRPDEARKAIGRIQALTTRAADLIAHLKKGDMAKEAERLLADTGWLPEPLRMVDDGIEVDPASAAAAEADDLPDFLSGDGEDDPADDEEEQHMVAAE